MADFPQLKAEGAVRLGIHCAGIAQEGLSVLSVKVHHALNDMPWARLVLAEGDMANDSVPLRDSELFKPGADIAVKAGYGDAEETIFTGVVVRLGFRMDGHIGGQLTVDCRAKACRMSVSRRTVHHLNQTDGEIIQTLIGQAGLRASAATTALAHEALVQYDCSDWDFVLARANAMGLLVNVDGDTVSVQPPRVDAAAALTLTWGVDLIYFDVGIDAGLPQARQVPDEGANAVQVKLAPAHLRGRASFQGSALARPGASIELAGLGSRFGGNVLLSSVEHELEDGDWITRAEFGRDTTQQVLQPGLLPGVGGLQIGVVLQLDGDPQGEHRILVRLPACQAATEGLWARLAHLHASSGFGSFFMPEVGDEVLLGHLDQDPGRPVVLGSLYSSSRTPPYPLTAGNNIKAVVTRSRHRIEFNDADRLITVTTPARNQLVFSDQDRAIEIRDQSGNVIRLSEGGIALDSPHDITLVAQGGIKLDAVGEISVCSKADVKLEGLNVACQAQVGVSVKGAATAELSASGQTLVRGAMVLIN
jgi:phage protein D